jgi:DNA-binding PadR family transcriptional regulator
MSIKHSLLALLAQESKYGYQLKTEFEAATGGATTLNIGQVYTTLQRLERDGLVAEADVDDEGRRSYLLTRVGRVELDDWFDAPASATTSQRDEVSIKVLIALASAAADPQQVLRSQRAATTGSIQRLTRQKMRTEDLAEGLHLDRQIMAGEAELRWLDLAEDRIDHHRATNNGTNAGVSQ